MGENYHSPWLGWSLEEGRTCPPPPTAGGWMGGPLSYSQPWKTSVCSPDANCLQPDTFLDLAERVEMRVKPLEAPPIPTSVGSKCMSGPILWAVSLLSPGHLSLAVCGRESTWLLGCWRKATSQGYSSGWCPGPLKMGGWAVHSETPALCLETNREMSPGTSRLPGPLYFMVTALPHPHITEDHQPGFPQPGTSS